MEEKTTIQKILEVFILIFLIALPTYPFVYLVYKYGTTKELIALLLAIAVVVAPFIWVRVTSSPH